MVLPPLPLLRLPLVADQRNEESSSDREAVRLGEYQLWGRVCPGHHFRCLPLQGGREQQVRENAG